MATWVTHFRIAEQLIDLGLPVSKEEFLVGNIGPDCGLFGEGGVLNPPKEITHFEVDGKIDDELFYNQYVLNNENGINSKELSFYLGYYVHLVTDQEWTKLHQHKKKEQVYQNIIGTPQYASLIKRDWYGLDFQYLEDNKDCIFWTTFQNVREFPDYLEIFPEGQVNEQIKRITTFYLENKVPAVHKFVYLTLGEVDEFVEQTVSKVKELLKSRISASINAE